MVFSKERKFVTKRLHVKTPTLKYGMYDRRSIPDVIRHSELYWSLHVGHDPIKFVGSREVYFEMNMQYQAFSKKRLEQQQLRDFAAGCASLRARRGPGPVARPIDYIFTGDEIIQSGILKGMPFRATLKPSHAFANRCIVGQYESGHTESPHCCDLARYIQQEYRACRYHYH
jgi:hypothetical protein